MTLREAVDQTVDALALPDVEAGAAAALVDLARRYAAEIDGAAAVAARASRLVSDVLGEEGAESALYERVEAIAAKLGEREALERLGRSLQSALVELMATPKARGVKPGAASSGASRLQGLRGGRAS